MEDGESLANLVDELQGLMDRLLQMRATSKVPLDTTETVLLLSKIATNNALELSRLIARVERLEELVITKGGDAR
jgi:hypothetical protein